MKIRGRVVDGNKLGRTLGYPTANIPVDDTLKAGNGVYAVRVGIDGRLYDGMANLGVKPTFGENGARVLEVHLFDYEGDLYGRELEAELIRFIRPERKFATPGELAAQIAKDKTVVKRALEQAAAAASHAKDNVPGTFGIPTFERITDTGHPLFAAAWKLYIKSFPPEERRQLRTQRKIMADAPYHFEIMTGGGGALAGILLWWGFADMRYVEHFATVPRMRGHGLGARALAAFTARSAVPVVLEVELPDTEMSRRRVGFYRRQGFVACDRPYTHPPYKRGGERVPLMLMAHPEAITDAQFASFLDTHHPVIHRFAIQRTTKLT